MIELDPTKNSVQEKHPAVKVPIIAKLAGNLWCWVGVIALVMTWCITRAVNVELPRPMPVLGQLPEFSLTDQHNQSFGSKQLEGKVWVANFIFIRCPTVCPALTEKMGEIQHRTRGLGSRFHLVSFSVDPDYDTPERLKDYAANYRASPATWRFLTGPIGKVKATVIDALKISMGNEGPEGTFEGIFHGSHFVVLDRTGQIRAYIDSNDADAVDQVVKAVGLVANRGG